MAKNMVKVPKAPKQLQSKKKKTFIRTKEDFTCGHCNLHVKGTGYTNHCPNCLWSRHIDVNPGDRMSRCRGMMGPISVEIDKDSYVIAHRCIVCGYVKNNTAAPEDNFEEIANLIKTLPKPKKQ